MSILINTISLVAAFCAMEIVAWASHKYIMHGFGWEIHKDHHVPHDGMFQRNDLFFLLFAIPRIFGRFLWSFQWSYLVDFTRFWNQRLWLLLFFGA